MTQCIAESRKPSVQVAWDTFAAQSLAVSSATTPLLTSWFEWALRLAETNAMPGNREATWELGERGGC